MLLITLPTIVLFLGLLVPSRTTITIPAVLPTVQLLPATTIPAVLPTVQLLPATTIPAVLPTAQPLPATTLPAVLPTVQLLPATTIPAVLPTLQQVAKLRLILSAAETEPLSCKQVNLV